MNPSSIHYVDFNTRTLSKSPWKLPQMSQYYKYSHSTKSALLYAALNRQSLSLPHPLTFSQTHRKAPLVRCRMVQLPKFKNLKTRMQQKH